MLFKEELINHCFTQGVYIATILDLLPELQAQLGEQELAEAGLLTHWLDVAAREAENDGKHSVEDRISALALLSEIWLVFTDAVDRSSEYSSAILFMFKRAVRDAVLSVKLTAAG